MRVYVDTNIILDFLIPRDEFLEDAAAVLELAKNSDVFEFMSASIVTDVFYNAKKNTNLDSYDTQQAIRDLLIVLDILPTTKADILSALNKNWKDFEDAVQYSVAENNAIDYFVTRNQKDFTEIGVPIITPSEFVRLYGDVAEQREP